MVVPWATGSVAFQSFGTVSPKHRAGLLQGSSLCTTAFLSVFSGFTLHTVDDQIMYSGNGVLIVELIDVTNSKSGFLLAAQNRPGKNTLVVTKTIYAVQSQTFQSFKFQQACTC